MTDSSKYLLKEYASFDYDEANAKEQQPDVSNGTKPLVLKGILQRADTLNQNGRVYPRHILEREVRNYEKLIREKRAFGELDHADTAIVNMKNISHMIKNIWIEEGVVSGEVEILDTPGGSIIKAIVKAGGKPGISSRALGSLQKENNVLVVQEDLQIICWDFVSEPSTPGAFMLAEAKKITDPKELRSVFTKSDLVDRAANEVLRACSHFKQSKT